MHLAGTVQSHIYVKMGKVRKKIEKTHSKFPFIKMTSLKEITQDGGVGKYGLTPHTTTSKLQLSYRTSPIQSLQKLS